MKKKFLLLAAGIMIVIISGCYNIQEIKKRSELGAESEDRTLMVLVKDSTLYRFISYNISDSSIIGTGLRQKGLDYKRVSFAEIPFRNITHIQAKEFSFIKTALLTGALTFWGVSVIMATKSEGAFRVETQAISTGKGSCPELYVMKNGEYELFGESFGIGFGKALELKTLNVLPELKETGEKIFLRICNQRPETHYFNSISMLAVSIEESSSVISDAGGALWSVKGFQKPCGAHDNAGHDITESVKENDGKWWKSDSLYLPLACGYRDTIDLTFYPYDKKSNAVSVTALNTNLIFGVFSRMFSFAGDRALLLMREFETDTIIVRQLKEWIKEGSLKASYFDGEKWEYAGIIYPEATEAPFTHIIRFDAAKVKSDTLRMRLVFMKDVLSIDRISLVQSGRGQLKTYPVQVLSAVDNKGVSILNEIINDDRSYRMLLPGEYLELAFKALPDKPGMKTVYAAAVKGYLYEWFEMESRSSTAAADGFRFDRVEFIKKLIMQKETLLPYIYPAGPPGSARF